ncbi:hypothetical protein JTB14_035375 [Gonioctena quinquepunctata]|nr:hypothetical protein JTB14_035375 [Gonioctena quinquepunctata]
MEEELCKKQCMLMSLEKCIDKSNKILGDCEDEIKMINAENKTLREELEAMKSRTEKMNVEVDIHKSNKNQLQEQVRGMRRQSEQLEEKNAKLLKKSLEDRKNIEERISVLQEKYNKLLKESEDKDVELEKIKNQFVLLQNNYCKSPRIIKEESQKLKIVSREMRSCPAMKQSRRQCNKPEEEDQQGVVNNYVAELEAEIKHKKIDVKSLEYTNQTMSSEISALHQNIETMISDNMELKKIITDLLNTVIGQIRLITTSGENLEIPPLQDTLKKIEKNITKDTIGQRGSQCSCMSIIKANYIYDVEKDPSKKRLEECGVVSSIINDTIRELLKTCNICCGDAEQEVKKQKSIPKGDCRNKRPKDDYKYCEAPCAGGVSNVPKSKREKVEPKKEYCEAPCAGVPNEPKSKREPKKEFTRPTDDYTYCEAPCAEGVPKDFKLKKNKVEPKKEFKRPTDDYKYCEAPCAEGISQLKKDKVERKKEFTRPIDDYSYCEAPCAGELPTELNSKKDKELKSKKDKIEPKREFTGYIDDYKCGAPCAGRDLNEPKVEEYMVYPKEEFDEYRPCGAPCARGVSNEPKLKIDRVVPKEDLRRFIDGNKPCRAPCADGVLNEPKMKKDFTKPIDDNKYCRAPCADGVISEPKVEEYKVYPKEKFDEYIPCGAPCARGVPNEPKMRKDFTRPIDDNKYCRAPCADVLNEPKVDDYISYDNKSCRAPCADGVLNEPKVEEYKMYPKEESDYYKPCEAPCARVNESKFKKDRVEGKKSRVPNEPKVVTRPIDDDKTCQAPCAGRIYKASELERDKSTRPIDSSKPCEAPCADISGTAFCPEE